MLSHYCMPGLKGSRRARAARDKIAHSREIRVRAPFSRPWHAIYAPAMRGARRSHTARTSQWCISPSLCRVVPRATRRTRYLSNNNNVIDQSGSYTQLKEASCQPWNLSIHSVYNISSILIAYAAAGANIKFGPVLNLPIMFLFLKKLSFTIPGSYSQLRLYKNYVSLPQKVSIFFICTVVTKNSKGRCFFLPQKVAAYYTTIKFILM